MGTLTKVLDLLTNRVKHLAEEDITDANISQIWGILLLLFVMIISPILVILAKNAISSIQVSKLVGSRVHFNHARLSRAAMHGKKACISARIILVMCQNVRGFLHSPKWLLQPRVHFERGQAPCQNMLLEFFCSKLPDVFDKPLLQILKSVLHQGYRISRFLQ